jgi:hypothetical protein
LVLRGIQPSTARIETVEPFMRFAPPMRCGAASPSALSAPAIQRRPELGAGTAICS